MYFLEICFLLTHFQIPDASVAAVKNTNKLDNRRKFFEKDVLQKPFFSNLLAESDIMKKAKGRGYLQLGRFISNPLFYDTQQSFTGRDAQI